MTRDAPVDIRGVGLMSGNSTAQFANCRRLARGLDEAALRDDRGHTRAAHAAELGVGRVGPSDKKAYRIFQRVCAGEFSDELRLYKLYARAQAFAGLTTDGGEADLVP